MHGSTGNWSDQRRLAFASCFTAEDNIQLRDAYIPCVKVEIEKNDTIIENGLNFGTQSKLFLDSERP
eukprot:UN08550